MSGDLRKITDLVVISVLCNICLPFGNLIQVYNALR